MMAEAGAKNVEKDPKMANEAMGQRRRADRDQAPTLTSNAPFNPAGQSVPRPGPSPQKGLPVPTPDWTDQVDPQDLAAAGLDPSGEAITSGSGAIDSVSYTHLTLPTIYSV